MNCRHYRNHCLDSNWQHSLCKAGAAICSLRHFWSPKPGKPMSGGFPGPLLVECVSTETVILLILPQQESGRTSDEGFCGNLWTIVFVLWVLHWKVMVDLQLTFSLWPFLSTSLWHWRGKKSFFSILLKRAAKVEEEEEEKWWWRGEQWGETLSTSSDVSPLMQTGRVGEVTDVFRLTLQLGWNIQQTKWTSTAAAAAAVAAACVSAATLSNVPLFIPDDRV